MHLVQGDHHDDSNIKEHTHTHLKDIHVLSFTFSRTLESKACPLLHLGNAQSLLRLDC